MDPGRTHLWDKASCLQLSLTLSMDPQEDWLAGRQHYKSL
jgi:hypothetical protein